MFEEEIKMMMYSFGDATIPKTSTATYIESIVKVWVKNLLSKAKRIQMHRKATTLEAEDICFVLRNEKSKIFRILQYINMKKLRETINSDDIVLGDDVESNPTNFDWFGKEECIDNTERLKAFNERTVGMSKEEYMEYSKCREASFIGKKCKKLKKFLGIIKVKEEVLEIIGFICYEYVYELVKNGIKVQKELTNRFKQNKGINYIAEHPLKIKEVEEGCRRVLWKKKTFMNKYLNATLD